MKIIHCADVHLDSKLQANLDEQKAKMRREEILLTFLRMVNYAADNGVGAILIAGDLFDTRRVSAGTRNQVKAAICNHPQIDFYLLRGNHETAGFLDSLEEMPENLKLFSEEWMQYVLNPGGGGNIVLTGAELSSENSGRLYSGLVLEHDKFNIVMLHGQQSNYKSKNAAENIALTELKNQGIDYLALGHVHEYHMEDLDRRGKWCYCGCLEGRGFDECGEHGFVLLEINEESGEWSSQRVHIEKRHLYTEEVDVTGCSTSAEILDKIKEQLEDSPCTEDDMLKIVLTGQVDVACEKNPGFMVRQLEDDFFFVKIYDETGIMVDYNDYKNDRSLKGEFVRMVSESEEPDEVKAAVIRFGLQALAGEAIE